MLYSVDLFCKLSGAIQEESLESFDQGRRHNDDNDDSSN